MFEQSIAFASAPVHRYVLSCFNRKLKSNILDRFFNESDGAVMNATPIFEGPAIETFKEWFGDRPIICPAPLDFPLIGRQKSDSPVAVAVEAFLDAALQKHGPNSVVYVMALHSLLTITLLMPASSSPSAVFGGRKKLTRFGQR